MSYEKNEADDNVRAEEATLPTTQHKENGAPNPLVRALESRHIQMIAIGGSIGSGLFVGTGEALADGGPAAIVICYIVVGILMLCTVMSLGELAVMYPVNGGYYEYSVRFLEPSWGVAVGWTYVISWTLTLPFEITAASLTIQYWDTALSPAIFITIFLVLVIIIQFFGVRGYGEVEFILSIIKIMACVGLIILGIIINLGGVPGDATGYIGGKYWHIPGAFNNGLRGFCAVFNKAVFAYSGTELIGLAAAETKSPRESLPKAAKQVFWRIALFYIVSLLIVGLNVPYNDPKLLGSGSSSAAAAGVDVQASPFVLVIQNAGIKVLPSIINAVVLISTLSVANSSIYASTRTIQAMALSGYGPKFKKYVDKRGRPLGPIIFQMLVGFVAYLQLASSGLAVFDWLLSIGSLSSILTYFNINLAHFRFRQTFKAQGRNPHEIPWKSPLGRWGSIFGMFLSLVCLVGVFYSALFAPGGAAPNAYNFFKNYLSAFICLCFFILLKCWNRELWLGVNLSDINLDEGRRLDGIDVLSQENNLKDVPWWKQALRILF